MAEYDEPTAEEIQGTLPLREDMNQSIEAQFYDWINKKGAGLPQQARQSSGIINSIIAESTQKNNGYDRCHGQFDKDSWGGSGGFDKNC